MKCWKCPPRSAIHAFTLFLMFDATRRRVSCITETVHKTRYHRFVWHKRIGKYIPKLLLTSWVRTRCQVVFDNEHSLHLWKRHPCTSTVWRQLTDWREEVATWRDLRGLLYSHSDILCLLTQSNCIELQPSINILIWVAWLFDHPVFYSNNPHAVRRWLGWPGGEFHTVVPTWTSLKEQWWACIRCV
jgi:hypothetical protein